MARYSYGGQALIEGVLMRGRDAIAVALRHPDGRILWADERLGVGFRGTRWARLPLVRGLVVLYETLVVGTRWLLRAASVAAAIDMPEAAPTADPGGSSWVTADQGGVSPDAVGLVPGPTAPAPDGASPPVASAASSSTAAVLVAPVVMAPAAATNGAATPTDAPAAATSDAPAASSNAAPAAGPTDTAAAGPTDTAAAGPTETAAAGPTAAPAGDGIDLGKGAVALMLGITLLLAVGLFFFVPLTLARFIAGGQPPIVERAVEGVIQVTIFLGYLTVIGRTPDVRRTFMYHGAEHMTIHALEAGDPLEVAAVRRYPTAHPRCGTEFLVVVILVSIVVFSLVGRQDLLVMILSRIVLIPVIAAISYELLRFGARHRDRRFVRWIFQPGIWVQMITTKQPSDDMIEVAIVSMEQAMLADGEPLPPGAGRIVRAPLSLSGATVAAASPEA